MPLAPYARPLIDSVPAWVLPGASLDMDFVNDRYFLNGQNTRAVAEFIAANAATFSRAQTGTYTDSLGNVTSFASGVPRRGDLGLLIEESRVNVALWNRDLTNAAWTKSSTTVALDQTGIDGTANSASSITATGANGTVLQAITLASSARFQTAYVKRITGSGVVNMTMDNGVTWTAITVTGAWTRVNIPTQTLANPTVGFRLVTSGDKIAVDGVQNENGVFATSVIFTTSASVTRAADVFNMPSSPTFPITLYANVILTTDVVSARRVLCLDDGSTANRANLGRVNGTGQINLLTSSGSSTIANMFSSANAFLNVNDKIAAAIASADYSVVLNNGTPATAATAGATPVGVTTLRFGNDVGGASANNANGYIKRAAFYNNTRLTNGAMGTLTT